MDKTKESKLKCLKKENDCNGNECFSEEECLQSGNNKYCYSMFKIAKDKKSVQKDDLVLAGCWNGDECHAPNKLVEKYKHDYNINISSVIPNFLLEPEVQNKCITYKLPKVPVSYRYQYNLSFCCCSSSMCNNDILITNEESPYKKISQMIKQQTHAKSVTTQVAKLNTNINTNMILVTSLILMSLLFIMLLVVLTFRKKCLYFKSKSDLPNISYNQNTTNDHTRTRLVPSTVQIAPNQNLEFFKQNQPANDEFRQLTQPLLNPTNETLFFQNFVPPNLDVLPESILKSNPVMHFQNSPQNVEIIKQKDLNELENFKARLEEQLAKSSKSSSIDHIDPNILPRPIRPCDIYLIEKVSQGQFSSVWKGRCLNNKNDNDDVPEYGVKIFSHMQKSSWSNEKDIYYSLSTINPFILTHFSSDMIEIPKNEANPNLMFSSNEYWIITEYHTNGSLCDFLKINLLSWPQMVLLVHSILEGLAYLHSESIDPRKQFAIAHRDLKSKNILVKKDGQTCCIADFGLALKLTNNNKLNSAEIRSKVIK